ncbi:MAG: hydrogenase expression/formation protein HypE [Candidatus Marinimicrobia bacterium]|nr:hydrogenase expression/formation protein HypE [Candidatus Neomarinimicrobiota bacterium]MBL7031253.1 hydrogenase expression/formation protein HypE [Candidatus Neomarinimicrobiota bacterium]
MTEFTLNCPIPFDNSGHITMAHGGGGKIMNQLIQNLFQSNFSNDVMDQLHDGAILDFSGSKLAFSTDSFVIDPLFFPGGDIGSLAVHGTVNDVAMCGAIPKYLSLSLILEEGFPVKDLERIIHSIKSASEKSGIDIVTGDTKVVDKGKGDGIYINTAGIGEVMPGVEISPLNVSPGDAIVISGDIGRHSIAIMAVREGLTFETTVESDSMAVNHLVKSIIDSGVTPHCFRDLTRGGLASALVEISQTAKIHIQIEESTIPVLREVRGACEILGFDPIYLANEGRFISFVKKNDVEKVLDAIPGSVKIGEVISNEKTRVTMKQPFGPEKIIDMLSGEQLPRIC